MKASRESVDAYLASRTTEEGNCLLWDLACNSAGAPVATIAGVRSRPVRRWVWEALHGPAGTRRVIPSCDNPQCVAPEHAVAVSPSGVNFATARRGGYRSPKFRRASQIKGRAGSELNLEVVREIRRKHWQEGMTLTSIHAEYPAASVAVLSRICRGESWADPADPWANLMTRNTA